MQIKNTQKEFVKKLKLKKKKDEIKIEKNIKICMYKMTQIFLRNMCLEIYELDLSIILSALGTCQAAVKMTKEKLNLLTDIDK